VSLKIEKPVNRKTKVSPRGRFGAHDDGGTGPSSDSSVPIVYSNRAGKSKTAESGKRKMENGKWLNSLDTEALGI
jgi:hypothetical protein